MTIHPRSASTLIILRENNNKYNGNFEVLMLLRHPGNKFLPSAYVFPGGAVERTDLCSETEEICTGFSRNDAYKIISDVSKPEKALAFWIAAIRETFEESGLLYAYNNNGDFISLEDEDEKVKYKKYRKMVYDKDIVFQHMIKDEGLTIAADKLKYFNRWTTPIFSPIRYKTSYFVARAPKDHTAEHDSYEHTKHIWITPKEALKRYKKNEFYIILPTISTLQDLCKFETIDDVIQEI